MRDKVVSFPLVFLRIENRGRDDWSEIFGREERVNIAWFLYADD